MTVSPCRQVHDKAGAFVIMFREKCLVSGPSGFFLGSPPTWKAVFSQFDLFHMISSGYSYGTRQQPTSNTNDPCSRIDCAPAKLFQYSYNAIIYPTKRKIAHILFKIKGKSNWLIISQSVHSQSSVKQCMVS